MNGTSNPQTQEQIARDGPRAAGVTRTEQKRAMISAGSGSSVEALAGVAAVALAIVGLAGVYPLICAGASAIVAGGALMLEGLAIAGAYAEEARHAGERPEQRNVIGGGMSVQVLGGAAGVTLGILALANIAPWSLLGVAAIVFGGTLLLGGSSRAEFNQIRIAQAGTDPKARHYAAQALNASSGAMALTGLAAITLGILALLQIGATIPLVLTSFLIVGAANLLGGSALVARVATSMR